MEEQMQQSSGTDWTVEEECGVCSIIFSIYSKFPPMPSAQALNMETGEFFPFERVRKLKSGYAMAEALGVAWACNCRERSKKRFDEQFTLRDPKGRALSDTLYTVRFPSGELKHGWRQDENYSHDHQGRLVKGLLRRRHREAEMFEAGIYDSSH